MLYNRQFLRTATWITAVALLGASVLLCGCESTPSSTPSATATEIKSTRAKVTTSAGYKGIKRTARDAKTGASMAAGNRDTRRDDAALTQPMVAVTGKVSFEDGEPVTTGSIAITSFVYRDGDGSMTKQDAINTAIEQNGAYSLTVPDAPYHSIEVRGNFPTTSDRLNRVTPSSVPKLREVSKDIKIQRGVEVRGRVIDEHEQPVAGASILIRKRAENRSFNPGTSSQDETSSTDTGEFVFPYVAPGTTFVIANHPNLAAGSQEIEVPNTGPVILRMLRGGATVTGHVYRQDTGQPYYGATVTVHEKEDWQPYPKKIESQADGSFRVEHVSPGKISISVNSNIPELGPYPSTDSPIGKTSTMADGDTTNVTLLVYPGHTIFGKIYDKETLDPLAGAAISSHDGRSSTTSDAAGMYRLPHIFTGGPTSLVQVGATLEGYTPAVENQQRHMQGGIPVQLTIEDLEAEQDIAMVKMVTASGTVRTADGIAIPGASVQIKSTGGNSFREEDIKKTESDGSYNLEVRPFFDGAVKAEATGYATGYSETFHVDNQDIEGLDIILDVGASVAGTVLDPDGKPAEKAKISASTLVWIGNYGIGDSIATDETDAEGRFLLSNLPKDIRIIASHEEYTNSRTEELALKPGESHSNVVLQLRASHTISGRVVDSKDQPLSNMHVYASGESHSSTQTDKDGVFNLNKLTEGVYRLNASGSAGHASVEGVKAGTADVLIRISNELTKREKATLIGTVVDATTNEPLDKFEIDNMGTRITKDPNKPGRFTAEGLQQGVTYTANIKSAGYVPTKINVPVPEGKPTFEHTFKVGKGGVIIGSVVDAENQAPIPNILVVNWGGTTDQYQRRESMPVSTSTTDEEGNFTLAPAPGGDNLIMVRPKAPLADVARTVKVENDQVTDAGKIEISRGGVIYGIMTYGARKEPLESATITIYGHDSQNLADAVRKTASTDADGAFRFEGLPPRNYSVSVSKYSVTKSVELTLGAEKEVNLHVGGTRVFGIVTRGGEPVRCSVSAVDQAHETNRVSTSAQGGQYELTGLSPGEWKFQIYQHSSGAGRSYEETVTISDTDEFEKDFILPDIRITGIVVDSNGDPVPGAMAMLSQKQTSAGAGDGWRGGFNASATTDHEGRFRFEGMTEGTYQVAARKDGKGSALESGVQARDGAPVDLRLELSTNGGTLVSVALNMSTGAGLPEAWCYLYGEHGRFTHSAQRGADGVMQIKDIPPGKYRANVSYWGYSQAEREVEIKAGETATIEDVLYPAGAIEWTLQKADGTPATATGTVTPLDTDSFEEPKSGTTDGVGKLVIRGLAAGNYTVTARAEGKSAVTDTFTVVPADIARKTTAVPNW